MLNGKELLDNNTHIIYEKITTDELPLKVIEVTLAKDDPNLKVLLFKLSMIF